MKKPFTYSSDSLFDELNVLNVRTFYIKNIVMHIYKHKSTMKTVEHENQTRSRGNEFQRAA